MKTGKKSAEMNKRKYILKLVMLGALLYLPVTFVIAQTIDNEFQLRTSTEFSKKIVKGLKVEITPELRWTAGDGLDKYHINTGLSYKPISILSLSAEYRLIANRKSESETEFGSRYQFNLALSDRIQRFDPKLKVSYTNYNDDDDEGGKFLKYQLGLGYDIPNFKLNPEIGFEAWHDLDQGEIYKYRTKIGVDYRLSDRLVLTGGYKLDYYMTKAKNRHIMEVGLKVKL